MNKGANPRWREFVLYSECEMLWGETWRKNWMIVIKEANRRNLPTSDPKFLLALTQWLCRVFEQGQQIQ